MKLTTQEHLSKHDREIAAIRTLMRQGMKMLVRLEERLEEQQIAFAKEMRELAAAQKRTDASLKAFIDSMRRGGNGHGKRPVDLQ